jgi:hypothetical protein
MNKRTKISLVSLAVVGTILGGTASSCAGESKEDTLRNEQQAQKAQGDTLEKRNLEEKRRREENPNAIGYVYLLSFGKPVGYYIIKGKLSSNGSQRTPEQDIHWTCKTNHGCQPVVVDGAQDDGSYGDPDPGIFFFTTEGVKVVTDLDYIQSDQPLSIDVPRLVK